MPIDFLLNQVAGEETGHVNEWTQDHQQRLQIALEGAKERMQAAAQCRKEQHDKRVRYCDLEEGRTVYLLEHNIQVGTNMYIYKYSIYTIYNNAI